MFIIYYRYIYDYIYIKGESLFFSCTWDQLIRLFFKWPCYDVSHMLDLSVGKGDYLVHNS